MGEAPKAPAMQDDVAAVVAVEDCDRIAAAEIIRWQREKTTEWSGDNGELPWQFFVPGFSRAIRQGIWDEHPVVQSYARHRLAVRAALIASGEMGG